MKHYKKTMVLVLYIQMLNEMRNARKVNKEQVKMRKIYRNVDYGRLTFVYNFVQLQKLNEKQNTKI